jgi:hypothetical protein
LTGTAFRTKVGGVIVSSGPQVVRAVLMPGRRKGPIARALLSMRTVPGRRSALMMEVLFGCVPRYPAVQTQKGDSLIEKVLVHHAAR